MKHILLTSQPILPWSSLCSWNINTALSSCFEKIASKLNDSKNINIICNRFLKDRADMFAFCSCFFFRCVGKFCMNLTFSLTRWFCTYLYYMRNSTQIGPFILLMLFLQLLNMNRFGTVLWLLYGILMIASYFGNDTESFAQT